VWRRDRELIYLVLTKSMLLHFLNSQREEFLVVLDLLVLKGFWSFFIVGLSSDFGSFVAVLVEMILDLMDFPG